MDAHYIVAFEAAKKKFPVGTRVKSNDAHHARLGPTRERDPTMVGTVIGYDQPPSPARWRLSVEWDEPKFKEAIAADHLEAVE